MNIKPSRLIKKWIEGMAKQGADIKRLSVRDYAIHMMIIRGCR